MKIPIKNFEQLIDPTILKRGLAYFKKGQVIQDGEDKDGELHFYVQGTEEYEVTLVVHREVIEDHTCDCPYTDGPVCKHIVAAIFFLTQDQLQLQEPQDVPKKMLRPRGRPKSASRQQPEALLQKKETQETKIVELPAVKKQRQSTSGSKSKKASTQTQIDAIIAQLTPEEIKQYVLRHVLQSKDNQTEFLALFADKNEYESVDTYRRQIKRILTAAKGRYGFVDYQSARKAGSAVFNIAISALEHTENGNFRSAMYISVAVLEEMTKALDFVDDSNGDVGENLEVAFRTLATLSKKPLPEELGRFLFDYAVTIFQSGGFAGWDWHLGMIEMAMNLMRNTDNETLLLSLLGQPSRNEYDLEQRQLLIYTILSKRKDKAEGLQYLNQHLDNSYLKRIALQLAFEQREYTRVKDLAMAAIQTDKKSKPGLLSDWYDWLIKVAEAEGDTAHLLEYARLQLLDHGRDKMPYFKMIKKHTSKKEWGKTLQKLIEDMSVTRSWQTRELIPRILMEEQDWVNLLGYLKHEAQSIGYSFDRLAEYGQHLIPYFKTEIGDMLQIALVSSAHEASNRRGYVSLVKDLRTAKKMGYGEMVKEIVHKLMNMYRHRPAMMEELRKV